MESSENLVACGLATRPRTDFGDDSDGIGSIVPDDQVVGNYFVDKEVNGHAFAHGADGTVAVRPIHLGPRCMENLTVETHDVNL